MRLFQDVCNDLFARDYALSLISNEDGDYCASYPLDIVILEQDKLNQAAVQVQHHSSKVSVITCNQRSALLSFRVKHRQIQALMWLS